MQSRISERGLRPTGVVRETQEQALLTCGSQGKGAREACGALPAAAWERKEFSLW